MAKGQQRSNREPKKPKKDKTKIAPNPTDTIWTAVDRNRQSAGKKK
jgi:hypothetical protein